MEQVMQEQDADRKKGGIKGDVGRKDRLAAELRANLVRRKARARKVNAATAGKDERGPSRAE